jgi:hypothetical protein
MRELIKGLEERFGSRGRYSNDPRWIKAKRSGRDDEGKPFRAGEKVLYYPLTKTFMTGKKAEQAWREFEAAREDELLMTRGM